MLISFIVLVIVIYLLIKVHKLHVRVTQLEQSQLGAVVSTDLPSVETNDSPIQARHAAVHMADSSVIASNHTPLVAFDVTTTDAVHIDAEHVDAVDIDAVNTVTDHDPKQRAVTALPAAASQEAGAPGRLWRWFVSDNLPAKIGSVVLLIATLFLVRYLCLHAYFNLYARFIAALVAGAMLAVGGYMLQPKKPLYGSILQGTGLGIVYITIAITGLGFHMFPLQWVVLALFMISALLLAIALRQNHLATAILAQLAAYLVPLLSHGLEHQYFASLYLYCGVNALMAIIAYRKQWRLLYQLGFLMSTAAAASFGPALYDVVVASGSAYAGLALQIQLLLAYHFILFFLTDTRALLKVPNICSIDLVSTIILPLITIVLARLAPWYDLHTNLWFDAGLICIYGLSAYIHRNHATVMSKIHACIALGVLMLATFDVYGLSFSILPIAIEITLIRYLTAGKHDYIQRFSNIQSTVLIVLILWMLISSAIFTPALVGYIFNLSCILGLLLLCSTYLKPSSSTGIFRALCVLSCILIYKYLVFHSMAYNLAHGLRAARQYLFAEHLFNHAGMVVSFFLFALIYFAHRITSKQALSRHDVLIALVMQLAGPMLFFKTYTILYTQFSYPFSILLYYPFATLFAGCLLGVIVLCFLSARLGARHADSLATWQTVVGICVVYWLLQYLHKITAKVLFMGFKANDLVLIALGVCAVAASCLNSRHSSMQRLYQALPAILWASMLTVYIVALIPSTPQTILLNGLDVSIILCATACIAAKRFAPIQTFGPAVLVTAWCLVNLMLVHNAAIYYGYMLTSSHLASLPSVSMNVFVYLSQQSGFAASVSLLWAVVGLGTIIYSHRHKHRISWQVGMAMLIMAAGKALFFDIAGGDDLPRIVALIVTGGILMLIGYFAPIPAKQSCVELSPEAVQ